MKGNILYRKIAMTLGAAFASLVFMFAVTPAPTEAAFFQWDNSDSYDVGYLGDRDHWVMGIGVDSEPGGYYYGAILSKANDCSQYNDTVAHVVRMTIRSPNGTLKWSHNDFDQKVCSRSENIHVSISAPGCSDAYLVVKPKVSNFLDPGEQTMHIEVCGA